MQRPDELIASHLKITEVKPSVHSRVSPAELAETCNEAHQLAIWIDHLELSVHNPITPEAACEFCNWHSEWEISELNKAHLEARLERLASWSHQLPKGPQRAELRRILQGEVDSEQRS